LFTGFSKKTLKKVFLSAVIYLIFVLFLYLLGVSNVNGREFIYVNRSTLLESMGINISKIIFPLTTASTNHFSGFISMITIFLFYISREEYNKKQRKWWFLLFVLFEFMLIASDTRTVIFSNFLLLIILILNKKLIANNLLYFAFLLPVVLIVFPLLVNNSELSFLSNLFSANGGNQIETINGRALFWFPLIQDLGNFKIQHLIGYGGHGNINAKAMNYIVSVVASYENKDIATAHNLYLQMIFDGGYIFIVVFVLVIVKTLKNGLKKFKSTNDSVFLIGNVLIVNFLLCGSSESLWGNYYLPTMIYISVLFIYINSAPYQTDLINKYYK
jgi:hypothetical protein